MIPRGPDAGDADNYAASAAGEAFDWLALARLTDTDTVPVDVDSARDWTVVLANARTTSTTMIGTLGVVGAGAWTAVTATERVYGGPGEHVAVRLCPPR